MAVIVLRRRRNGVYGCLILLFSEKMIFFYRVLIQRCAYSATKIAVL